MDIVSVIAALALPLAAFFFWARGLIKSRRDDIVLGFSILVLICVVSFVLSGSSAVFSGIGILIILFGVETLIVSAFAKQDCPINKKERISLGVAALVAGLFFSMIV